MLIHNNYKNRDGINDTECTRTVKHNVVVLSLHLLFELCCANTQLMCSFDLRKNVFSQTKSAHAAASPTTVLKLCAVLRKYMFFNKCVRVKQALFCASMSTTISDFAFQLFLAPS